ncbi:hypothetical protein GSI_00202 [Ganoderma sinense ZZ0214-1]|uniref:Uncharacterized protein n=1 Tax=Ganoderma sinense ZZ0214-1 TaxID=1077348 RepID=A0A2G8SS30_9APHY|nr:hypothetical protein GSI_00202 [Ganoderma sinense ZZ0214-1]
MGRSRLRVCAGGRTVVQAEEAGGEDGLKLGVGGVGAGVGRGVCLDALGERVDDCPVRRERRQAEVECPAKTDGGQGGGVVALGHECLQGCVQRGVIKVLARQYSTL